MQCTPFPLEGLSLVTLSLLKIFPLESVIDNSSITDLQSVVLQQAPFWLANSIRVNEVHVCVGGGGLGTHEIQLAQNPPAIAGYAGDTRDVGLIPGSGSLGGENGNRLHYSCLEHTAHTWWGRGHRPSSEILLPRPGMEPAPSSVKAQSPNCCQGILQVLLY